MKAFDTSVLLAILHGERGAKDRLRRFRGIEVATTELNMLELYHIVSRAPRRGRLQRQEALERLRRSLTVLPFDHRAADRAARRVLKEDSKAVPWHVCGILGTLEANGCDELITLDPAGLPGRWAFKVGKL
jgi:predicted nucleic acid-binding protein